jgi:hypothetical protein
MSNQGVNWSGLDYLADNAATVVNNLSTALTRIGNPSDTSSANTLFGKLADVLDQIATISSSTDTTTILTKVTDIQAKIGATTDTSAENTIFGDINTVNGAIGAASADSAGTVFGQLDDIQDFTRTSKSNAGAALGAAQEIQRDLGVYGATPDIYSRLKDLESYVKDIKSSAEKVTKQQEEAGGVANQIISTLQKFLEDQSKAAGMQEETMKTPTEDAAKAKDLEKVHDKLEEIDAKMKALKEAMQNKDVVIKTWYESE